MGILGYEQRNYMLGILYVLDAWGGKARRKEVIDALMNDPEHRFDLTQEEKAQRYLWGKNKFSGRCDDAVQQLRKEGYVETTENSPRGIWIRTQKLTEVLRADYEGS